MRKASIPLSLHADFIEERLAALSLTTFHVAVVLVEVENCYPRGFSVVFQSEGCDHQAVERAKSGR